MIAAVSFLALLLADGGAATQAPDPHAKSLTPAEAETLVREVSAEVEKIRGLKFKTPVTMQIVDGAAAREQFKAKITPWLETEIKHTQHAYTQLGLIPKGVDMLASHLDLAEKGVLGYYEHGSKTFYLLDRVAADEVRGVMAHELTHALEDQNYDLGAVSKRASGDSDHGTAISALIEGSAMVVMLAYLSREVGEKKAHEELEKGETERAERLSVAPSFTQRSLALPYILGFTFLLRGKPWAWITEGGVLFTDLDHAYANPPRSTRQILHPEQYWLRQEQKPPPALTLPDLSSALGPGWSKATDGSIGELGLAVLTGANNPIELPWALLPSRWTNEAANGTAGDVYHHYVNGDSTLTVLLTRWETMRDADEFERALVTRGKYRYVRYGANLLVLVGDVGDKAEVLAAAALQNAAYWPVP